jgi:hypothetical protein
MAGLPGFLVRLVCTLGWGAAAARRGSGSTAGWEAGGRSSSGNVSSRSATTSWGWRGQLHRAVRPSRRTVKRPASRRIDTWRDVQAGESPSRPARVPTEAGCPATCRKRAHREGSARACTARSPQAAEASARLPDPLRRPPRLPGSWTISPCTVHLRSASPAGAFLDRKTLGALL